MKTYENYMTWLLLSSTLCLTQDLLTQQKCGSWHQLKARCYSNSTNVLVGFSQLLFYLFGGCCHSISQPWSASTVLSKLQVVPALTVFHNRKPSFCFLSLRQVLPPRLFVVFRPHCKWNQRFLASLVWKRDLQGISRDHFFSPGALIQAFYGGSPTSIKDLHGPPWFSLIWLWVFDSVRKSVVSIDSSHLFSFYGRNWRNTGCKVSFEAISCDSFRVVRTHSTLLCAPSKKPMLWSTTWWKKASKHEKRRWAVDLLPQLFELFFLDATQWIQNSTMILKLS